MRKRKIKSLKVFKKKALWLILLALLLIIWFVVMWGKFFDAHSKLVPSEGGIYTESIIGKIQNLNPLSKEKSTFDQGVQSLIFAGLLKYNPVTAKIEDGLGELRIGEDGKTYEVILKDSARFSDGKKVTMQDVLFTFEKVIQNPHFGNENLNKAFEYVTIDVVDDKTVQFVLPEQNVFFLSMLTTPILPHYHFKKVLINEVIDSSYPYNQKPIGAGPYRLKNIILDRGGRYRVFLERNPYYYGDLPLIPQIVLYLYPDIEKLKADEVESTILSQISSFHIQDLQDRLNNEYIEKNYLLPRYLSLHFNLDRPFTKFPKFRKALSYGVNKDQILNKEKGWQRIDSPFFFEGIETGYQVNDFKEARNILRDSGFPYSKAEDIRTLGKGGERVVLNAITATAPASYSRMLQSITKTWEDELDIEINISVLEEQEFQVALEERSYDVILFGSDFSQNFDSLSAWHSSQTGRLNLSNLTRDDIDFLVSEIRFSGAQSDFFQLSQKLDELIPAVMMATPQYTLLVSKDLKGFDEAFGKIRKYSDRFSNISKWHFFEKENWDLENQNKYGTFFRWIFQKKKDTNQIDESKPENSQESEIGA